MKTTIDLGKTDGVRQALERLSSSALAKFSRRATHLVAMALKGVVQRYPGPPHSPVLWSSDKQRRAYFAMRREGGYPLKYTRGNDPMSQRLQQSWTVSRDPEAATLSNRATYAPYVMSDQLQTRQHKASGWMTVGQAIDKLQAGGTVDRIVKAELNKAIKDAFK